MVYYREVECHEQKLVHYLQCQGHSKGSYNQNMVFYLSVLNFWSVCKQTWFDSTASEAGVSCGKIGLLHPRSRSQWRFKMLVNVCLDNVFWTTEHFVVRLGIMQHHKPVCHAKELVHCLQCQGHSEGLYNQNIFISAISSKLLVCLLPNLVS